MFEQYKLNKYSDYLYGLAYDYFQIQNHFTLQTYLVIKKDGKYSFIKFNKSKNLYDIDLDRDIQALQILGYKHLSYYIEDKKEKDKTFLKSKFTRIK